MPKTCSPRDPTSIRIVSVTMDTHRAAAGAAPSDARAHRTTRAPAARAHPGVDQAYRNRHAVEFGMTAVDHDGDAPGGTSRAVKRAKGRAGPVYSGDRTRADGVVRTLGEPVAPKIRTRSLSPTWTERPLRPGYEGVRRIEAPERPHGTPDAATRNTLRSARCDQEDQLEGVQTRAAA